MRPEVHIFDPPALFQATAKIFTDLANQAIANKGSFSVALSGGSTPRKLFDLLADLPAGTIAWQQVYFFWGDERHVPPESPQSNYGMARECLLSKIPVPPENIFRVHAEEKDAAVAAREYEEQIQKYFHLAPGQVPVFDLITLGMGPEGHTASLFPGSAAVKETKRLVVSNRVEKLHTDRITFTFPLINHAACVLFLVAGKEKASAVRQVFEGPSEDVPASLVHPQNGRLIWMLEGVAAAELPSSIAS